MIGWPGWRLFWRMPLGEKSVGILFKPSMPLKLTWAPTFCALPCAAICCWYCMYCEAASPETTGLLRLLVIFGFFCRPSRLIKPDRGSFALLSATAAAVGIPDDDAPAPPKSPKSSSSSPPAVPLTCGWPIGCCCCCWPPPIFILPKASLTALTLPCCG